MFLNKLLVFIAIWSVNAFSKPPSSDSHVERTPKDIVADYKNWQTIRFVKGGISFKIPKEFKFESDEPNPTEDIAVMLGYVPPDRSKLKNIHLYVFLYPRTNDDPFKLREQSLEDYLKKNWIFKNVIHSDTLTFNNKIWKNINVRYASDPKRKEKVSKVLFHKITSRNKNVNGKFLKIDISEHNFVDICTLGSEPPCGPTTEKFYSWPIIEKILESVEYIE